MKVFSFFLCIVILVFVASIGCVNEKKPLNPNGDSELAVLMREMYEDGVKMKSRIEKGRTPSISVDHEEILSANPTDIEQVDNPEYRTYAAAYLGIIDALKKAKTSADAENLYDNMVQSCANCHKALCPGPLVRIAKLRR